MDARIFRDEPIGLKDDLLTVPLEARFSYDAERNIFFLNMEGVSVSTPADAEAITAEIEKRLTAVGKKVPVVVNYDNFYLAPDLADTYASVVRSLAERYYYSVTRYTTSSFMRLKLSGHLSKRGLAPHIYESRQEALDWLNTQHRQPIQPGK
jgi:propionate CoA-transferase